MQTYARQKKMALITSLLDLHFLPVLNFQLACSGYTIYIPSVPIMGQKRVDFFVITTTSFQCLLHIYVVWHINTPTCVDQVVNSEKIRWHAWPWHAMGREDRLASRLGGHVPYVGTIRCRAYI